MFVLKIFFDFLCNAGGKPKQNLFQFREKNILLVYIINFFLIFSLLKLFIKWNLLTEQLINATASEIVVQFEQSPPNLRLFPRLLK